MTARPEEDRGLGAVHRVREVREQDSRIGLQGAIGEHRTSLEHAAALHELMRSQAESAPLATGSGDWVAHRTTLRALADLVGQAEQQVQSASVLRTAAEERWRSDRTRVRAVETMLKRRADRRREDAVRRTARDLDDLAGQRWLARRRAAGAATAAAGGDTEVQTS